MLPSCHNPFYQGPLKFSYVLFVIHEFGSNCPQLERWIATVLVEVLVGVSWLGIKVSNQVVPMTYYFGVKERYGLCKPFGSELHCQVE